MSRNARVSLTIVGVVAAVVGLLLFVNRPDNPSAGEAGQASGDARAESLVRPDSHKLSTAADGKVTVVEFLDLECEACAAVYPGVEQLREEYGDRITFVLRQFPLPSHLNAELAARAVEAAANQGRLEQMYSTMFRTQPYWGGQRGSHRETFLGFARDLGLDLARFETDLDARATIDRVQRDRADGVALGVKGTPTFFVNGVVFGGQPSYQGLKAAIDSELAR